MSDLKWQTLEELERRKKDGERYIGKLRHNLHNAEERMRWINHYIEQKTYKGTFFGDLDTGDFFRFLKDDDKSVHLKVKDGAVTCVRVHDGKNIMCSCDTPVTPISGRLTK